MRYLEEDLNVNINLNAIHISLQISFVENIHTLLKISGGTIRNTTINDYSAS